MAEFYLTKRGWGHWGKRKSRYLDSVKVRNTKTFKEKGGKGGVGGKKRERKKTIRSEEKPIFKTASGAG